MFSGKGVNCKVEQMDRYWEMASWMVTMVSICSSACLFARFLKLFLKRRRFAWEAGGAYIFAMLVAYYIPLDMLGMISEAAGLSAVFVVICLRDGIDQESHPHNIYVTGHIRNLEQKNLFGGGHVSD